MTGASRPPELMIMNVNMERAASNVFQNMLDHPQFGGGLQVPQQSLSQKAPAFAFQGMAPQQMPMSAPMQFKQQEQQTLKLPADQTVPNVLQNMMNRGETQKLTPSNVEASLLSLVDGELRVSSLSSLPTFLKILPRCSTEPERTLAIVVLRATSTAKDTKLSHACAGTFEKSGGLRLARAWVDNAVAWQQNDLLVLLLEVLQTLPLQLTSITEARINEPIVKLKKNAREERVKRAAQDLLKFWRSKFTEKEKPAASSTSKSKDHSSSSKSSSSTAVSSTKHAPSTPSTSSASSSHSGKEPKVLKKRTIKRLERLPFGGGNAVSKSSDLIGSLMQRKSAKEAAAANAAEAEKKKSASAASSSSSISSSSKASDVKMEEAQSTSSSGASDSSATAATSGDDELSIPLPTIQSFKAVSSASSKSERKRIRWADENGAELVKVKLIESWRDLVPYDPHHDDQSFRDAKLREHANERHAMLSQHHKVPPAVAATKAREWTTPAFMRLPDAVAARITNQTSTDEMRVQDDRMRREVEYEVLAGEVPAPSPKEWERVNEPHRGPAFEIPLSDVAEVESNAASMPVPASSAPMMVPPTSSALPANSYPRDGYAAGGYNQAPDYDQRSYNGHYGEPDPERKLREALGPLQENTMAMLLDNQDVVPQVLDEAQRYGNRISDARVLEIVEQHRRAHFQAQPNGGMQQPPAYSPYGSQQQYGGDMGPAPGFDHQYQQYPPQQGAGGPPFMPGKRKADAMGPPQNGLMADGSQSFKRQQKKSRAALPCRYFVSPVGCKHGTNCHFAHVQPAPANGPELIYNNNGPMMGGRGGGPVDRYGPMGMHGGAGHHLR